ncbi:MAG TPA: enoyl-CoA hydratase/isomerase family protein [Kofleriaceae bacterium]|nr:enoyl-CoA hydratase/isomerase family protein [Kofleriaceae bacterium]
MFFEITMAGPAKNAMGSEMMRFLLDRIEEAAGRPILLTGTGDAFSAGLNLKEVAGLDASGMEAFLRLLERLMTALFSYPGPTVALVNGHAIAGGCMLTLCCDHRVAAAAPDSKIGLNELALGLRFPPRVMAIVRHRVPRQHVERVILGSELWDPREAHRLGLVDEVAEDARTAAGRELALRASYDPSVYAAGKADLRGDAFLDLGEDDSFFARELMPIWTSPVLRERIAAVLARGKRAG